MSELSAWRARCGALRAEDSAASGFAVWLETIRERQDCVPCVARRSENRVTKCRGFRCRLGTGCPMETGRRGPCARGACSMAARRPRCTNIFLTGLGLQRLAHVCSAPRLGVAQPGRARALGARGRRFESCRPDQFATAAGSGRRRSEGRTSFSSGAASAPPVLRCWRRRCFQLPYVAPVRPSAMSCESLPRARPERGSQRTFILALGLPALRPIAPKHAHGPALGARSKAAVPPRQW